MLQPNEKQQVQGKPVKISFDDASLFQEVASLLQQQGYHFTRSTSSGLVFRGKDAVQDDETVSLLGQLRQLKKKAEVHLGDGSQLNGVILKLVQKQGDTTTSTEANFKFGRVKTGASWIETLLWFVLIALASFAVSTMFIDGRTPGNWPLSPGIVRMLKGNLNQVLKSPQHGMAAIAISEAFEYHDGFKMLSIQFVGDVDEIGNTTVQQISRALFGSPINDRVLYLDDGSEELLRSQIFAQLTKYPMSIVVMDFAKVSPTDVDFLVQMLDGTFPALAVDGQTIRTNQAVFLLISNIMEAQVTRMRDNLQLEELEKAVKYYMQGARWPTRILQRLDHVIPFFQA